MTDVESTHSMEKGETNPDFAVQTFLQFLKLLFLVALNILSSNGQDKLSLRGSSGIETFRSLDDCLIA